MKHLTAKHILLITLLGTLVTITGCEEKGPAEKAGEKIDKAFNDSNNAIDEAIEDAKDKSKEIADDIKDATN